MVTFDLLSGDRSVGGVKAGHGKVMRECLPQGLEKRGRRRDGINVERGEGERKEGGMNGKEEMEGEVEGREGRR